MYRRILLAYDGSVEGRSALREGAILAKRLGAEVFLLSVVAETEGMMIGDGAYPAGLAQERTIYREVLEDGAERLRRHGMTATTALLTGEPASTIADHARNVGADLVVVGQRKRSLVERWWRGSTGGWLSDKLDCSLLVAKAVITEEAFDAAMAEEG